MTDHAEGVPIKFNGIEVGTAIVYPDGRFEGVLATPSTRSGKLIYDFISNQIASSFSINVDDRDALVELVTSSEAYKEEQKQIVDKLINRVKNEPYTSDLYCGIKDYVPVDLLSQLQKKITKTHWESVVGVELDTLPTSKQDNND